LLARDMSVAPSFTRVPLHVSILPAGSRNGHSFSSPGLTCVLF
jgi:hypothetical protein